MATYYTSQWVNWWSSVPRYNYTNTVTAGSWYSVSSNLRYKILYGPYSKGGSIYRTVKTTSDFDVKAASTFPLSWITNAVGKAYKNKVERTTLISGKASKDRTYIFGTKTVTGRTVTVKRTATYTYYKSVPYLTSKLVYNYTLGKYQTVYSTAYKSVLTTISYPSRNGTWYSYPRKTTYSYYVGTY